MSEFYGGQRVVVLGGAGFIGQHLCQALTDRGADVRVIDNLSRHESQTFPDDDLGHWHKLDISGATRSNLLENIMGMIKPFAVFNLAASVANVQYNQEHHHQMFLDNAALQTIPVMICEKSQIPHFLQVSSACVYGEGATEAAIESDLGGNPTPANAGYSWAKRMGENAIQWGSLPHSVIVRPSNAYGPGDWYDDRAHVIPKLIKGYDEGTAKLYGDGLAVRQYIYVKDVVGGMIHALEHGADKEAYNLAAYSKSVGALHRMIASHFGTVMVPKEPPTFDQGDARRFSDGQKMYGIGWTAHTPFETGLKRTIEAYLEKR